MPGNRTCTASWRVRLTTTRNQRTLVTRGARRAVGTLPNAVLLTHDHRSTDSEAQHRVYCTGTLAGMKNNNTRPHYRQSAHHKVHNSQESNHQKS